MTLLGKYWQNCMKQNYFMTEDLTHKPLYLSLGLIRFYEIPTPCLFGVGFAFIYLSQKVYSVRMGLHCFIMRLIYVYMISMQGNLVFMQWLQEKGLLKACMRCMERECRGVMHLKVGAACQDGYHWVCTRTRCEKTKSLRIGSFFCKSHLSLGA